MKYIMLIPVSLFFLVFTAWPLIEVVKLSLFKTNFITSKFIGMDNYIQAFQDSNFLRSILNSLFYILFMVPGEVITALFFALLLYPMTKKWQDASRLLLYLPSLSAGIIIAQAWKWVFHNDGPINWLLSLIGMAKVSWFGEVAAIPSIVFIVVFSSFGAYVIIFLAALQSVGKEYIEAARIDGARWNQIKIHILIPMIMPTVALVALLSAIAALQIFETIFMLGPYDYAANMNYYIYTQGFQFSKYGMASAEAVILLLITVGISILKTRVSKSD